VWHALRALDALRALRPRRACYTGRDHVILTRLHARGGAWTAPAGWTLSGAVFGATLVVVLGLAGVGPAGEVGERRLVDNERVVVVEFVFPPGFRGEEHVAPVDEFAYVVEGEFAVVTKGKGKNVVRRGEVEWAPKGVVHYSVNETKKPARVLVVLLKER
jgi:quercetin dioxygenase-like cupin family protein